MEAVIENPYILVYDKKISAAQQDLIPLLEKMMQIGKRDLVIIAEDIDGEALATLVLNKLRGTLNVLAVISNIRQLNPMVSEVSEQLPKQCLRPVTNAMNLALESNISNFGRRILRSYINELTIR